MANEDFPSRLGLALKALSISRGRLATELGVDKSVVSRWLNGANAPSGHNLSNLTALISTRCSGFTMLDWEGDLATLVAKLGVGNASADGLSATPVGPAAWLPPQVLREAVAATEIRGGAYEGLWRTTRLANETQGCFVHDRALIRKSGNGLLSFRLGVGAVRFQGWAFPSQTQIFAFGVDDQTGVFIFVILNAVLRHRADVMDGISLTCQRDAGGTVVAGGVLMERTGMLTGDEDADNARYEASVLANSVAPEGSIPEAVRARLFRDVGPSAFAAGGDALLMMSFAQSLSRGPKDDIPFPE
jgi:Helix-turn-helix